MEYKPHVSFQTIYMSHFIAKAKRSHGYSSSIQCLSGTHEALGSSLNMKRGVSVFACTHNPSTQMAKGRRGLEIQGYH